MKTAIVTGAAGDIGRAICAALLSEGIAVAGFDVHPGRLEQAGSELAALGRFLGVQVDVTNMTSIRAGVERVAGTLGDTSILVNNAGGISRPSLLTTREEDWLGDIDLNLNGPWRCIHALQDTLIRCSPSVIVNIASVNGLGIYGHPGYSAAKAGLIHLTRFCAVELGKFGVRSVAICPGSVKTRAWEERRRLKPEIFTEVTGWYPSRDICEPADIATLVALVAGKPLSAMNGSILTIDGGLTAGSDRLASLFTGETL